MIKVSIVVPVYNAEKYLSQCIDSIINQTLKEIEIIIINDGSNDSSGEICEYYKKLDDRITVFHTHNKGVSAARNLGIEASKGLYIGFVDGDDFIHMDMFKNMYECAEKNKADIVECGYNSFEDEKYINFSKSNNKIFNNTEETIENLINTSFFSYMVCLKLFSNSIVNDIRFPINKRNEDVYFICDTFVRASKVCYINKPYYNYRKNSESFSNTNYKKQHLDIIDANRYMINLFKGNDKLVKLALIRQFKTIIREYFKIIDNNVSWRREGIKKIQEESKIIYKEIFDNKYSTIIDKIKLYIFKNNPIIYVYLNYYLIDLPRNSIINILTKNERVFKSIKKILKR